MQTPGPEEREIKETVEDENVSLPRNTMKFKLRLHKGVIDKCHAPLCLLRAPARDNGARAQESERARLLPQSNLECSKCQQARMQPRFTPTAINGSFIIARRSEWPPRELYFIFCTTRAPILTRPKNTLAHTSNYHQTDSYINFPSENEMGILCKKNIWQHQP
jgi:hypothetical protein